MKRQYLSHRQLYGIIVNTPKLGARATADKLGCSLSSIYYINSISKKAGYALIGPRRLKVEEKVKKILKSLRLI